MRFYIVDLSKLNAFDWILTCFPCEESILILVWYSFSVIWVSLHLLMCSEDWPLIDIGELLFIIWMLVFTFSSIFWVYFELEPIDLPTWAPYDLFVPFATRSSVSVFLEFEGDLWVGAWSYLMLKEFASRLECLIYIRFLLRPSGFGCRSFLVVLFFYLRVATFTWLEVYWVSGARMGKTFLGLLSFFFITST